MYEDEAITIAPNQDGCLLSDFKDTLCDLLDSLWLERCTALYRHVDVRDRKFSRLIMVRLRRRQEEYPITSDGFSPSRNS